MNCRDSLLSVRLLLKTNTGRPNDTSARNGINCRGDPVWLPENRGVLSLRAAEFVVNIKGFLL
jgi:hypothetical protein